jgi:hypothetical protein
MVYFINCYEFVDSGNYGGTSSSYRLYSSEDSEGDLKRDFIEDLKSVWSPYNEAIASIDIDGDFYSVVDEIRSLVSMVDGINEYDLSVQGPYTNTTELFDFYNEYDEVEDNAGGDIEYGFYFYGDYAVSYQSVIPYLADLHADKNLNISNDMIAKMFNLVNR